MSAADGAEAPEHTETGYLRTTLSATATGWALHRRPGLDRVDRLRASPEQVASIAAHDVPGVRWGVPQHHSGDGERFDLPGPASIARLLLAGMPSGALARMLAPVPAALDVVRRHGGGTGRTPAGLLRLGRWIADGTGPRHAARLHAELADRPALLGLVRETAPRLAAPSGGSLGAAGGNTLHPHPGGGATGVLLTEELADAAPEWDLGWLLGELLELLNDPQHTPGPRGLRGYPPADVLLAAPESSALDPDLLARACLVRWTLHLHDYAAYVDWAPDLPARLDRLDVFARRPALVLDPAGRR